MYETHFNTRNTPQTQPIPGKAQVQNNAGGFVYQLDDWGRLDRFLFLGTLGGTYYVNERDHTVENLTHIQSLIEADGHRVIKRVVEISTAGRAMKNDPALFVLAMCSKFGNVGVRKQAAGVLPLVARTGTHLLTFVKYRRALGGFGRLVREALQNWYVTRPDDGELVWQVLKYQSRGGWSHRDVLRMVHPRPRNAVQDALFAMQTGHEFSLDKAEMPALMAGFLALRSETKLSARVVAKTIELHGLPWEMVPTEYLAYREVWEALLPRMPYTAMVRNLGKMTSVGLLQPLGATADAVAERIADPVAVRKARYHPMNGLVAARTYASGKGLRGSLSWEPVPAIVEALEAATQNGFAAVEPTGKRFLLGVDVSGSMGWAAGGNMPLSCAEAAAALALIVAKTEPKTYIYGFASTFKPLCITPSDTFRGAAQKAQDNNFGRTDCSLPMVHATKGKLDVDCFVVLTDNETYAGKVHPSQALQTYREKSGIPAKLIVVGMTSSGFTIADPTDAGMLDVVGCDSNLPTLVSRFAADAETD